MRFVCLSLMFGALVGDLVLRSISPREEAFYARFTYRSKNSPGTNPWVEQIQGLLLSGGIPGLCSKIMLRAGLHAIHHSRVSFPLGTRSDSECIVFLPGLPGFPTQRSSKQCLTPRSPRRSSRRRAKKFLPGWTPRKSSSRRRAIHQSSSSGQ